MTGPHVTGPMAAADREVDPDDEDGPATGSNSQRLDKWLWCARVAKTRTQASTLVTSGKIRVNRVKTDRPAHQVRPGDVITASVGPRVRILKVLALGIRRGPPADARLIVEDLSPVENSASTGVSPAGQGRNPAAGRREPGSGRPTKRDRRLTDRLKGEPH
ncbi:MAG: RNA-binding S4 domain-containing protein [Hyphomicrobium sp.]|nr:RNA-binding S4 domain-containing protein [Hyphomicrobium sp.]